MNITASCNSDEILEIVWMLSEQGTLSEKEVRAKIVEEGRLDDLEYMAEQGLLSIKDGKVQLSQSGEEKAVHLIRRHRLAERLLVDVLQTGAEEIESSACEFEHILSDDVVDKICILLGHPKMCPHDLPIPEGKCCKEAKTNTDSIIFPLSKLKSGESATVAYVLSNASSPLRKLMSFGVIPGVKIKLHQKSPSCVIKVGETQVALEESLLKDIYVR